MDRLKGFVLTALFGCPLLALILKLAERLEVVPRHPHPLVAFPTVVPFHPDIARRGCRRHHLDACGGFWWSSRLDHAG